jgi:hypothetical protein
LEKEVKMYGLKCCLILSYQVWPHGTTETTHIGCTNQDQSLVVIPSKKKMVLILYDNLCSCP